MSDDESPQSSAQAMLRFADDALLAQLVELLPPYMVTVREGAKGIAFPVVRHLAEGMFKKALIAGHEIDRSNGDGPLEEWDGWLIIAVPEKPLFLQIAQPGGGVLPD